MLEIYKISFHYNFLKKSYPKKPKAFSIIFDLQIIAHLMNFTSLKMKN